MTVRRKLLPALLAAALGVAGAASPGRAAAPPSSLVLSGPSYALVDSYNGEAFPNFALHLMANGESFELWSHRADYSSPITTSWHHGATVTELPAGTMDDFGGLSRFFDITVQNSRG
ncbi:MAG: hypothetical protein ACRDVG_07335, partial [Jatrophihabitantaceae bacterium]